MDVDTATYGEGLIPAALGWNWRTQLRDTVQRDIMPKADIEKFQGEMAFNPDQLF